MQRGILMLLVPLLAGCGGRPEVVVYSALDKEFSGRS